MGLQPNYNAMAAGNSHTDAVERAGATGDAEGAPWRDTPWKLTRTVVDYPANGSPCVNLGTMAAEVTDLEIGDDIAVVLYDDHVVIYQLEDDGD